MSTLALDLVRVSSAGHEAAVIAGLDIHAAMSRLSARDRALLVLRYYEDLPIEEVGRVLRMSPAATRVALHRAAHRLRPLVELTEAPQ
jgi:RNA polymerase sigma factor (sigma-70 family)